MNVLVLSRGDPYIYREDPARIQRGGMVEGRGSGSPKNHKNIGFPSNTGLDSLKNRASIQCWGLHHRPASDTPLKWRFAFEPMMVSCK